MSPVSNTSDTCLSETVDPQFKHFSRHTSFQALFKICENCPLCSALLLCKICLHIQGFKLIPFKIFMFCTEQSSKCKNKQQTITLDLGKEGAWFLCTALLLRIFSLHSSKLIPFIVVK